MISALLRVRRAYGAFLKTIAVMAGLMAFLIMAIIVVNAALRFGYNMPFAGSVETTEALLPALIMWPFGYALFTGSHVNTVVLTRSLPKHGQRYLQVFWSAVGACLFAVVAYATFRFALRSYEIGERVWGADFSFPQWPAKMAVAIGALLLVIQFTLDFMRFAFLDSQGDKLDSAASNLLGAHDD